jgi:hypothetical protein
MTGKNLVQDKIFYLGFYQEFIKNFATKAHALTMLTPKNVPWKWTEEEEDAIQFF